MSKNSYSKVGGENVRLLQALIDEAPSYTKPTNSRNANILKSIINNTEYNEPPQSEIEELLIALKAKIGGEIEVNELTVTENGSYDAGLNKAYNPVNVELPLDSKEITANGTYNASDNNLAGFSQVTVNVEGYLLKDIENTPTAIATFSDGANLPMPKLEVGIEPQQDLHGYDAPWVGGAGKNKCGEFELGTLSESSEQGSTYDNMKVSNTARIRSKTLIEIPSTCTISCANGYQYAFAGYDANMEYLGVYQFYTWRSEAYTFNNSTIKYIAIIIKRTDEGNIQSNDYTNCHIQLEVGSTATSYAPYSNICPISGWSECNVARTGKNLYGGIDFANGVKDASPSSAIDTTNKTVTYSYGTGSKTTIFDTFKPLTSYTFLFKVADCSGQNFSMRIAYTDGTKEGIEILTSDIGNYVRKVSDPNKTVKGLVLQWYQSTLVKLYYDECGIFEGNIQTTDFASYQGHTYTIDLDGTRYGGKVDLVSGVMVLTDGYIASYNGETLPSTWISDRDVYSEGTSPTTGAEVVYKLATPLTIQLPTTVVKSLRGENNVWADSGNVLSGKYFAEL